MTYLTAAEYEALEAARIFDDDVPHEPREPERRDFCLPSERKRVLAYVFDLVEGFDASEQDDVVVVRRAIRDVAESDHDADQRLREVESQYAASLTAWRARWDSRPRKKRSATVRVAPREVRASEPRAAGGDLVVRDDDGPPKARARPVAVPRDPRVRGFLDALSELVAESVLRDLGQGRMRAATPTPNVSTNYHA